MSGTNKIHVILEMEISSLKLIQYLSRGLEPYCSPHLYRKWARQRLPLTPVLLKMIVVQQQASLRRIYWEKNRNEFHKEFRKRKKKHIKIALKNFECWSILPPSYLRNGISWNKLDVISRLKRYYVILTCNCWSREWYTKFMAKASALDKPVPRIYKIKCV